MNNQEKEGGINWVQDSKIMLDSKIDLCYIKTVERG